MFNKNKDTKGQGVQLLFTMLLFMSLLTCALFSVVFGADVYKNINYRMDRNFNSITALSYVSNKVKQNDVAGYVTVDKVDGISVLKLAEYYDGNKYETMIYCKDGHLMEVFAGADSDIGLDDGLEVMELKHMEFSISDNKLLHIDISPEDDRSKQHSKGNVTELTLCLRTDGAKEVAYE